MIAITHRWITVALTIALSLSVQIVAASTGNQTDLQTTSREVAATVNGQPIYVDQLETQVQVGIDKYRRFNSGPVPPGLGRQLQAKVLDKYIAVELLYQASLSMKTAAIEQKVVAELAKLKTAHDHTRAASVRRQIYIDEYLAKNNLSNPEVPASEIKAYYERHKQNFASKKDAVHVRHIVIQIAKTASPAEIAQAQKKIARVRQLITEGKPFTEVAKEYSEDANAPAGGDLGYIEKGYMPSEFEKVAFVLQPGKLSDLVQTEFGYHLLEVVDRRPAGSVPGFAEMKDFLAKGLQQQLKAKNMSAHLKALEEKATIEILLAKADGQIEHRTPQTPSEGAKVVKQHHSTSTD